MISAWNFRSKSRQSHTSCPDKILPTSTMLPGSEARDCGKNRAHPSFNQHNMGKSACNKSIVLHNKCHNRLDRTGTATGFPPNGEVDKGLCRVRGWRVTFHCHQADGTRGRWEGGCGARFKVQLMFPAKSLIRSWHFVGNMALRDFEVEELQRCSNAVNICQIQNFKVQHDALKSIS